MQERTAAFDSFKITPEDFARHFPGAYSAEFYKALGDLAGIGVDWDGACEAILLNYKLRMAGEYRNTGAHGKGPWL